VQTARAFHKAINEELAPHQVTFPQAQVLGWLSMEEGLSQSELAQRMEIEPPTLAGILDRMERDHWIVREPCTDDRRRKIVRPGPQSRDAWRGVVDAAQRIRKRATRGIPPARLDELRVLLEQVRTNLHPADEERDR
jgi:MarR family transcriptional regulator for hemolysin